MVKDPGRCLKELRDLCLPSALVPHYDPPTASALFVSTMQLRSISSLFALCASAVLAQTTVSVSYDQIYNQSTESLNYVACSETLESYGYTTFGDLPNFPYIGGAAVVTGFDAPACGSCWQLTYEANTINILVIDSTATGFNIATSAMNNLTNNQAMFYGRVNATATSLDASVCGLGQAPVVPN